MKYLHFSAHTYITPTLYKKNKMATIFNRLRVCAKHSLAAVLKFLQTMNDFTKSSIDSRWAQAIYCVSYQ